VALFFAASEDGGTVLSVSTLLMKWGSRTRPTTAGKGGLMRGYAGLPSRDYISADSSTHSYAPGAQGERSVKIEPGAKNIFAEIIIARIGVVRAQAEDIPKRSDIRRGG